MTRRAIEGDDDGANDAEETANLPEEGERLLKEHCTEHGADDDGESAEWSDEDCGGERVSSQVGDCAVGSRGGRKVRQSYRDANLALGSCSPSPMIIMIMPVHHSGDLRYWTPSPATVPYFFCDERRPFFLKTKDEPMRKPRWEEERETSARSA